MGSLRRNGIVKFHNCDGNGPSYRVIVYNSSFTNNFMVYSPEDYMYSNAPINPLNPDYVKMSFRSYTLVGLLIRTENTIVGTPKTKHRSVWEPNYVLSLICGHKGIASKAMHATSRMRAITVV